MRSARGRIAAFIVLGIGIAACAFAADFTPLDRYLDGLKSLRAEFAQTLVDSRNQVVDRSTGTLVVLRPGKFRWEVTPQGAKKENAQLLVADGRNVWFFDRELEQVTVKPEDAALSSTPAMLLSGAGDFRKSFTVESAGERDGLEWVLVEPRGAEADFRRALLGFKQAQLTRMIIDDKLGQTATVEFKSIARNEPVAPADVSFAPPAGVDVIGTPTK
jgi:outer membrane lipoprotein carrier protein